MSKRAMYKFARALQFAIVVSMTQIATHAAPLGQAASDEIDSQALDPNGFRWMMICIGLLAFCALSLIGGVVFYIVKSKKDKTSS